MRNLNKALGALALVAMPIAAASVATPAHAQAANPADAKAAGVFIDQLADQAFAVLRDKGTTKPQARAKFRTMLRQNFAVEEIGPRLIRRHRATATPQQLKDYAAVFPDWVVGTYADRLYEYANSDLKVVRTLPRGARGDVDVFTRITLPSGGQPIDAVWSVKKAPTGKFLVQNLTVAGVNLALTQEADFSAYIQKNGFDGLLKFMRDAARA